MEKIMNKLVRDKIPDIIKNNGEEAIYHILNDEEYKLALKKKLEEECLEVLEDNDILEECADVLEVIDALVNSYGFSWEELLNKKEQKKEKRGGFNNKIFLEKTK